MRRLLLLRHAPTALTRAGAFPVDEPLDERGAAAAARLRGRLPGAADHYVSPSLRARETARLAGLDARVEPALAECDFGDWSGRTLSEVGRRDPGALTRWLEDATAAPHGGESLAALLARVAGWLAAQARGEGTAVAVTHGGPIRAAVLTALGAPPQAFWRIEAPPLAIAELRAREGAWSLVRLGAAA